MDNIKIDNLNTAILHSLRIKNFKVHDDLILEIKDLTDIYGENRVGKSSIMQAIRVGLFPKKSDATKIKHGEDHCEITITFMVKDDTSDEYQPIVFNTKITKEGKVYKKDNYKNVFLKQVAKIRESLVSHGTFDPRELLEKGKRTEYLLKILPLKIEKEELLKHLTSINEKNSPYEEDVIYEADGFLILKDFEKYIRNIRHSKGLVKEERKKSYEKREKDYQKYFLEYKENYGDFIENLQEAKEEFYSKREVQKINKSKQSELSKEIDSKEEEISSIREEINSLNAKVEEHNKIINDLKLEITKKQTTMVERQKSRMKTTKELHDLQNELKDLEKENKEKESFEKRIHWEEQLNYQKSQLSKEHEEVKLALEDWGLIDTYIKQDFNQYKRNKISESLSKIKHLKYENGQLIYNNSDIEELSESEIIELGIKIKCIQSEGSNFFGVDCAEALDKKICKEIGKIAKSNKKKLILIRVADEPLNEEFNSIKIT